MYKDFNFQDFSWSKNIDAISYHVGATEIKIKITANSVTKYIIIPNDIYNYVLKAFKADKNGALDYIVDYSVKNVFGDLIENFCSWNNDLMKQDFNKLLKNVTEKIDEEDLFFKNLQWGCDNAKR